MAQIARRKIFGRSRSKDKDDENHKSSQGRNNFSVDILGAEAIFMVDVNSYFRDKLVYGFSLGIAGKKPISQVNHLSDVKPGTCWNTRVLILRPASICLCAVQTPTSSTSLKDSKEETSYQEELLHHAGKVETNIVIEDIEDVIEYDKEQCQLQINTLEPTGYSDNIIFRTKNVRDFEKLQQALTNRLKSYDVAMKRYQDIRYRAENDPDPLNDNEAQIFLLSALLGDGSELSIKHLVKWNAKVPLSSLLFKGKNAGKRKVMAYVKYKGQNYKAEISLFHMRLAEKDEVWVRADPIHFDNEVTFEEECENEAFKPVCLRIETNKMKLHREVLASKDVATTTKAQQQSHGILSALKNNQQLLILLGLSMLGFLMAPDDLINRSSVLGMLFGLVLSVLTMVKDQPAGHDSALQPDERTQPKSSDFGLGMMSLVENNAMASISFVDFDSSLRYNALDPNETAESLKAKQRERQLMKLKSQRTQRSLRDSKKGVDQLISALCGAYDDSLKDEDVPQKWIDATDSKQQAILQWRGSLKWRREFDVDNILEKPQPFYEDIKKLATYGWLGLDNEGSLVVIQKLSYEFKTTIEEFRKRNITPQDFATQSVFLNEYWIQNRLSPTGRINHILDLDGFTLSTVSKGVIDYLMPMNRCMQQYPELLIHVYVVNAPSSFRWIWRIISPFLAKKTTEKFQVVPLKKTKEKLCEYMSLDQLPTEYGGTNSKPLYDSTFEKDLLQYVRTVNAKAKTKMEAEIKDPATSI